MINDTIKRVDAINALYQMDGITVDKAHAISEIRAIPSTDKLQGTWLGYEIPNKCSICGHYWDEYVMGQEIFYNGNIPNYCPNCGAYMKGIENE